MRGGNATEKMMKIPAILGLVCGLIGVPAISQADTFLFTVIPSAPLVGSTAVPILDVSIAVSGLTTQSLAAYDMVLSFDPNLLVYVGSNFGDPVLGDQLELNGVQSIQDDTKGSGSANVVQVSQNTAQELDSQQPDSFTVVVLQLRALGVGVSPLTLSFNAVGDSLGNSVLSQTAVINSSVHTIPEPGVFLLVGFGLAGVFVLKRRVHP